MKISTFTKLSYALAALPMTMGLLSSCADQDFDWEGARMQNVEYAYRKNFEKAFGEIKPDQSWDFSSSAVTETRTNTRALGQTVVGGPNGEDYYYVNKNLLNWINTNMPEKGNSLSQLSSENVVFTIPNGPFTIYPVFQGLSLNWDLYMTVAKGGSEVETELVWKKSQNIQRQDGTVWKNLGLDGSVVTDYFKNNLEWYNGIDSKSYYGYDYVYGSSGSANEIGYLTTTLRGENSTESAPVRTKGYRYDLRQYAGRAMSFNLIINARSMYWKNVSLGANISSLSNQMRFIDLKAKGLSLPEFGNKDVFVIGIEDADYHWSNGQIVDSHGVPAKDKNGNTIAVSNYNTECVVESDFDYNDLVLIIVADKLEVKSQEYDTEVVTKKRYMVEDLGTTDDIDFNDMVVDIEDVKRYHHKIVTANGTIQSDTQTETGHTQTAHVRALGGTLDFDFYIGNELVYSKSEHQPWNEMINTGWENTSIDYEAELTKGNVSINLSNNPWIPNENNVKFLVYRSKSGRSNSDTQLSELWTEKGNNFSSSSNVKYNDDETKILIQFPEVGQTPYIIAVDTDKKWRNERRPICAHWVAAKNFSTTADCEVCKGHEHGTTEADKPTSENGVVSGTTNNDPGLSYFASTTEPYKGGIVKITYSALSNGEVTFESSNDKDVSKLTGNGPTEGVFYVRANTIGETTVKLKIAATDTYRSEEVSFKIVTREVPTPDTTGETVLSNQVTEELGAPFNVATESYSQARYYDIFNGKDVKVGDKLRFYILPTNSEWKVDVRKMDNWDSNGKYQTFSNGDLQQNSAGYKYFELTVTQDMINDGGDFMFNGTGFICTKITLVKPVVTGIDISSFTFYAELADKNQYQTLTYPYIPTWNNTQEGKGKLYIRRSDLKSLGLTTNSKLRFYKDRNSTGEIRVHNPDNNWSQFASASDNNGTQDYLDIQFTQDMINHINESNNNWYYYAFAIQGGNNLKINKIAIIK